MVPRPRKAADTTDIIGGIGRSPFAPTMTLARKKKLLELQFHKLLQGLDTESPHPNRSSYEALMPTQIVARPSIQSKSPKTYHE